MNITPITLDDVLQAKESKALTQLQLLEQHKATVLGIAINMPGNIKCTPPIIKLLEFAATSIRKLLQANNIPVLEERRCFLTAGPYIAMSVQGEPQTIKRYAVVLENSADYCRLLDIDVYDTNGLQISRNTIELPPRKCLICKQPAVLCVRNRTHEFHDTQAMAQKLLTRFVAHSTRPPEIANNIATQAVTAMLLEAICSPAPGLVDRFNSGSHRDMDIFTFMKSSAALHATMYACAQAGYEHHAELVELLPALRLIGLQGESDMFQATDNVNTQKGLIFLLGILAAATGYAHQKSSAPSADSIITTAQGICQGITKELEALSTRLPNRPLTAGEDFYLKYGVTGIRGEIESGLPAIKYAGLPTLQQSLEQGLHINDALINTLIAIMAHTQDTTILHRSDPETLQQVQKDALHIIDQGGMHTTVGREAIQQLDRTYIEKNISPGGSADLLAATYFLYHKI